MPCLVILPISILVQKLATVESTFKLFKLFLPSYRVGRACEPVSFWQGNLIAIVIRSTQGSSKNVVVVETRLSPSSNVKLFMY